MKSKIHKILGVGLTLVLVLTFAIGVAAPVAAADYTENDWGTWGLPAVEPDTDVGPMAVAPDGTLYAAVGPTIYTATLDATAGNSAAWSTSQAHSGSSSALLTYVSGDNAYVEFTPLPGITVDDLASITAGWSFWYYLASGADHGPLLELRFISADNVDPDGAGHVDITVDTAELSFTTGSWIEEQVTSSSTVIYFGNDPTDGTSFFDNTGAVTLAGVLAAIDAETEMTDGSDSAAAWQLTRVRAELGWVGSARTCYIDDITVNFMTYDLETGDDAIIPFGLDLYKSEDNGYTWDETELEDAAAPIIDIAISPNYEEDETLYVGCADGTVYRVEEAGEGDVIAIKDIVDSEGTTAGELFSMDVWTDEDDYNWILVGTDLDVLVLQDKTFEDWRDQELASGGDTWRAYEVAFAPDFDDSDLIWAVVDDASSAGTPDDFLVTATASPGQWGEEIGEVDLGIDASPFADIGFPDDYESDPDGGNCIMYVGLSSPDTGDVYLIEGVDAPSDSNAIALFDLAGETPVDIYSIAVSGNYGEEVILAGEQDSPTIWISDDGGESWDDVDKSPTGAGSTCVIMEAGVVWGGEVFDTEEGMAFAATFGDESAVSRSNDGGLVYNQVGFIDTELDDILDLAFHPDFPDETVFLMITEDTNAIGSDEIYSLWLTENGDEDEPDYIRVLCGYDADPPAPGNLSAEELRLVEYSQDADAIYLTGEDDDGDESIWKSTDDGQTFGKRRDVEDDAQINAWVITEDDTIYAAASDDGFYKTTNSGLSWSSTDVGTATNDIALSPDFEEDETILLGGDGGEVFMSDDDGDTFEDTGAGLDGYVFVAFDADFAVEDADGYMLIYAADDGTDDDIQVGEVTDIDDVDWDALEDDTNETPVKGDFYGLVVSEDNALYAIADTATYNPPDDDDDWTTVTGVARLLLHETDSIWEYADEDDLDDPEGLWVTPGTNVLWTIDTDEEVWNLEDTCSGQVELSSPTDGYMSDSTESIQLVWDEVRDADEYEYHAEGPGVADIDDTTDDTDVVESITDSAVYDWKVRVAPGEPWHSRWSDEWTFSTALGEPMFAPTLYAPENGADDVLLTPAFSWETAKNADSYAFMLADNPAFTTPIVDTIVDATAFTPDITLDYEGIYYWKVQALRAGVAISRWSDVSVFTALATPVVEFCCPDCGLCFDTEAELQAHWDATHAPVAPTTPAYIWVIIAVGALLVVAMLILILRTRRVV